MAHASYFLNFLLSYTSHTLAYLYHPAFDRASRNHMTIHFKIVSLAVIAAFIISCSSSKQASSAGDSHDGMEHIMLDTMMVHAGESDSSTEDLPAYKMFILDDKKCTARGKFRRMLNESF